MGLRDLRAKAIFQARVECPIGRNPGDVRPVGAGMSELLSSVGSGYGAYCQKRGSLLIALLAGGDKSTQAIESQSAAATEPSPHPQLTTLKAIQQLGL